MTHSLPINYGGGIGIVYAPEAVGSAWLYSCSRSGDPPVRREHELRGGAR